MQQIIDIARHAPCIDDFRRIFDHFGELSQPLAGMVGGFCVFAVFALFALAVLALDPGFDELNKYHPANNATTNTAPMMSSGVLLFAWGVFFIILSYALPFGWATDTPKDLQTILRL